MTLRTDAFAFDLPEDLIALRPAEPRGAARLLAVAADGALADRRIADLPGLLRRGDLLVFNDTKVLPARLSGKRGAAAIEATLLRADGEGRWVALAKPGKRFRLGDTVDFQGGLGATVAAKGEGGEVTFRFDRAGVALREALDRAGVMPLPPYIAGRRKPDDRDRADYQTVFARAEGAVAAPTAGLHFSGTLLDALDAAGIARAGVTLHVGAGTFLPVKAATLAEHKMHAESGEIGAATVQAVERTRAAGGRVVAIGTTSLRLLESVADERGRLRPFRGETAIFIIPGYRFRVVDLLLTNFHLPRSTLFMLVAAFAGLEVMKRAYAHAIAARYRFYSYGDACLIERAAA